MEGGVVQAARLGEEAMGEEALPICEFDARSLQGKLQLTLAADVGCITAAVEQMMTLVRQLDCAAGHEFEIELALREALANAIRHGSGNDPSKQVQCCVACDPARGMLLVVRDEGPGFDPSELQSPVLGQNVFSDHGRGIYLINQLMDEVHFEKGGTEIHMLKRPANGSGRARKAASGPRPRRRA
jgi:serine/threonine-protein kinase RsbW